MNTSDYIVVHGDPQEGVFKLVRHYVTWYIWTQALEIVDLCAQQTQQNQSKTGQRFICNEVISYKIHILIYRVNMEACLFN